MPVFTSFLVTFCIFIATSAFGAIPGDCDFDGTVTIAEVQNAVNMSIDPGLADICVDLDDNMVVTNSEVQLVVEAFLGPVRLPSGIIPRGAYIIEGDATRMIQLPVRLSAPTDTTVSVDWATADNTATAGADYVTATGTLTFNPGETEKSILLQVIGDTAEEATPRENFKVLFSNPVGTSLAASSVFVTIEDDDRVTIGAGGGVVRFGSGIVTLHALSGALAADTDFSATTVTVSDPLVVGSAWNITPAAMTFGATTRLSITYTSLPPNQPAAELVLARWDGTVWQPLSGSHIDATAQTVTAAISATGTYALRDRRNHSTNIAYVVQTPAAGNEFTTVVEAMSYVCGHPGKGRVIIRRSPVTIGSFYPACDISLEREEGTPVTIAGTSSVVSASPISFNGFNFGGAASFIAGSDVLLYNNQFAGSVAIFLDSSPPAPAISPLAFFAQTAGDCTHSGTVDFSGNTSIGDLHLEGIGNLNYCGNANVSDSTIPAFHAGLTGNAKMTGTARLGIGYLNVDEVIVKATAEGTATLSLAEVNTRRMLVQKEIMAGISGPRLDMYSVNTDISADILLTGGGTFNISNKGLAIRKDFNLTLLDDHFQGTVHSELSSSEIDSLTACLGGSSTLSLVDGVSLFGRVDYCINAGLLDGSVISDDVSYQWGFSADLSKLPLSVPVYLRFIGSNSTDLNATAAIFGIEVPLYSPTPGLAVFAPPAFAAPAAPVGLNIDGFRINSGTGGLASLKNGIHIDLENRTDPIEIKNTTYSVGQANAIVVQNAKGTVLIQGNTVTEANFGIALENIAGQVTIDTNTITATTGIVQGNNVQSATITGNTITATDTGLELSGMSSGGLRQTTASGNIITADGLALMLASSTILDFQSNNVTGIISVAAPPIYTAYATVVGNTITGQLVDNIPTEFFYLPPTLVAYPANTGLDPETDITSIGDWNGNTCSDFPTSFDYIDPETGECALDVGVTPPTLPQ